MIEISLLICTRNRIRSLGATLASIAEAAERAAPHRIELIVVDNGSTDGTAAMVRRWATDRPFAVRLLAEPRPGLARARNRALDAVRGRIVAMTDDDCILHPDYFDRLARAFAAHPAPVIIGGRILPGDPADLPVTIKLEDHPMRCPADAFPGGFVMGANLAFHAEVQKRVGPFDPRFGAGAPFRSAEDTDFLLRAQAMGIPLLYDPGFVVDHHHGRRQPAEGIALLAGYGFGDGALYAKYIGQDRRAPRWLARDVRHLTKRFAGPVAGIPHFHAFRLRHVLAGFIAYAGRALTGRRRTAGPASAA
ncbi:glycosyltransferase family 2 protein [uncultured Sphingomonas sp.]|uniref:glycosyltransferase family 2 protein n=1 Tax=uncultured Sphingomonas sp. TaxID=158754 RepID=UPI0025DCFEF2|nr:glycosyltransferase family A protein [uncultured Sphingomonas sp.]